MCSSDLWLYLVDKRFASSLAVRSSAPPDVKGTTILTGLFGQSDDCAKTLENTNKRINGILKIFFMTTLSDMKLMYVKSFLD